MARSDYAHWNEDADRVWWEEEGRHTEDEPEPQDPYDDPRDYDEPECMTPADCERWSCFSLPGATGQWECDICGRRARENENGDIVPDWQPGVDYIYPSPHRP